MTASSVVDVLVVGGGLSGLATAVLCQQAGLRVKVLEAAPRVGGRVHSVYSQAQSQPDQLDKSADYLADLGPTWVWPPYQPSVQRAVSEFKLQLTPQYNEGLGIVERAVDQTPERYTLPSQDGMSRLQGGPQAIVNALLHQLDSDTLNMGEQVRKISDSGDVITVHSDALSVSAKTVVLCTPLRIAATDIEFIPALHASRQALFQSTPTWMAAQAKVVLFYSRAFWREDGLSGRVASHVGPLVEVHDHSGAGSKPYALFGFLGVPAQARAAHQSQLKDAIVSQLVRCFGEQAATPDEIYIEDWALNRFICAQADLDGLPQHPNVLPEGIRQGDWDGRLLYAVAETSASSPGLIDGALDAAFRTATTLTKRFS